MSKNTVRKHVESLERKGFITTESTTIKTKDGRVHNGSLKYTLHPIKPIEEAFYERQLLLATAQMNARKAFEKYQKSKERSEQRCEH